MKIEHLAIWSKDIERLKTFYTKYFNAQSNEKYTNEAKGFESYFLSFDSGARLEIMQTIDVEARDNYDKNIVGLAHFAVSVGSKEMVESLTDTLRDNEYTILSEPRTTGDGYYESIVADPDGNKVEITI